MDKKEDLKINFETAVTEAIDEVLTTLGENVKRVVYIFYKIIRDKKRTNSQKD